MRSDLLSLIRRTANTERRESGIVLITVLIFLVVLTLSAYMAAAMTTSNVRVVTNLQNAKEAFAIAEAGISEALYRLSIASPANVPITGVNGGNAFNASLAPQLASFNGGSPFGLNPADTASTTNILLSTAGPSRSGSVADTPTLQPIASRLRYSQSAAGASGTLQISWDVVGGSIRQILGRPVIKIESTGQVVSGTGPGVVATKTIRVHAIDVGPDNDGSGLPSAITLGSACNQGIRFNGGASLTAVNAVQVNAGPNPQQCACPNNGSSCAISGGNNNTITASDINVVGDTNPRPTFSPAPQEGALPMPDPLAGMLPPCFPGYSPAGGCQNLPAAPVVQNAATKPALGANCNGTAASPSRCVPASGVSLDPGIYYGGIQISGTNTLNPGVYIIAGGGFIASTGDTSVLSTGQGGVTIYNTLNPENSTGAGAYGSFTLGNGNATTDVTASTGGYYQGIALFQARANTMPVLLQGGTSGDYHLDGAFYAPNAPASLQGHANSSFGGSIIVQSLSVTGNSNITIGDPTTQPPVNPPGGVRYVPIAWQDF